MMSTKFRLAAAAVLISPVLLFAQAGNYKVQTAERAVPKEVSEAVKKLLSSQAAVVSNAGKDVAEFWHRKEIPATASEAQLKTGINYRAIKESEVIGVVRFIQDWSDYRKQKIKAGIYTMRMAYQPLDGDHAGASQFTEFVLLLKASDDAEGKLLSQEELYEKSMAAAGTTHPAVFMLFPNPQPAADFQLVEKAGNHLLLNSKHNLSVGGKSVPLGFGLTIVGSAG